MTEVHVVEEFLATSKQHKLLVDLVHNCVNLEISKKHQFWLVNPEFVTTAKLHNHLRQAGLSPAAKLTSASWSSGFSIVSACHPAEVVYSHLANHIEDLTNDLDWQYGTLVCTTNK